MSNDYQSFLQQRHSQFNTPEEAIQDSVSKATHQNIKHKQRLLKGESNEVYDVSLENGNQIIVRINHENKTALKLEKWAIEQCERINIPVPKILLVEEKQLGDTTIVISIETKILGTGYGRDGMLALPRNIQKLLINEAGEMLAKIHTVTTQGFGDLNEHGVAPFPTLEAYIEQKKNDQWYIEELAEKHSIGKETIQQVYNILEQYKNIYKGKKSKLLHNDYGPDHIFYENNEIVGIIDFETARGGDPVQDFARWDYYYSSKFPLEWLQEGYTNKELFDDTFLIRLNIHRLLKGIILLYHHDKINNTLGLEIDKKNFASSLEFFNNIQ